MKNLLAAAIVSLFFALALAAQPASGTGSSNPTKVAETPKKTAVFRPNKEQIKQVQTILKDKKLYAGEATGKYNDETRAGIRSFQNSNGLKDTGTLNRATLEKFAVPLTDSQKLMPVLESSLAKTDPAPSAKTGDSKPNIATNAVAAATPSNKPKKPAPFRANEDQIKAAQKILIDGKMFTGEQSGKLDDATRDGLKKYQDASKLKVTGTLNAVTLEKMGIALTDTQKANIAAQNTYDAANKK